jgi:endogenous inhibitor of DNA gyrase (YacG/DUF329 family)
LQGRTHASIVSVVVGLRRTPNCPTCRAPVRWENNPHRPFCSQRCRMVDLGNWATERYHVAGDPIGEDDETGDESAE